MTTRIFVPRDAAARAVGADKVAAAIADEAKRKQAVAVEIVRNGSRGLFWLEPLSRSRRPSGRIAYGPVTAKDVAGLFAAGLPAARHPLCVGRPRRFPSSRARRA